MLLCCNLNKTAQLRENDDDESTLEDDESYFGSSSGGSSTENEFWEFELDDMVDSEDYSVSTMSSSSSCISDSESESDEEEEEHSWRECGDENPKNPFENYDAADCCTSGEFSLLTAANIHSAELRRRSCHIGRIEDTTAIDKLLLIRETSNLTPETVSISSSSDLESVDTFAYD
jgi:hypothetical protein